MFSTPLVSLVTEDTNYLRASSDGDKGGGDDEGNGSEEQNSVDEEQGHDQQEQQDENTEEEPIVEDIPLEQPQTEVQDVTCLEGEVINPETGECEEAQAHNQLQ